MDNDIELRIITLKDLWDIFVRRWVVMLLAGGYFAYTQITFVPQYEK